MLPAKPTSQQQARDDENKSIRPGSWWRLKSEDHAFASLRAPDHGLVLMMSEVRIIDGDIHTVVFHPHPLWKNSRPGTMKILLADLLENFGHEPDGEALRELEIGIAMNRMQEISSEMKSPPDPALLLQRKKDKETAEEEGNSASDETADHKSDNSAHGVSTALYGEAITQSAIPASLLPSQDVLGTQNAIETRIEGFEEQKNWITGKTDELKSNMDLVSAYQMEKVNTTLAAISQEVTRAESLLENVQTMRLFLGEDMSIIPLLDGEGADPSEPLTMMQRMLFLDEEIIINDLLEGFSSECMQRDDLVELFSSDFSLVERMLPYPRCAAIVRVRRNDRSFNTEGMDITQIFGLLDIHEADKRVHILVRDGRRLSMITADSTTSGAERFFPSEAEINALFKTRSHFGRESKEILPDNVEYSDARAEHDKRALFYKRFLILMWGMHERTDVFGLFMPKGENWLSARTHSERFRFIHDEENVLEDGRPSVHNYVASLNASIQPGSRVLAKWQDVIDGENAPTIATTSDHRPLWNAGVELVEEISTCLVDKNGSNLTIKAPIRKNNYRTAPKVINAKVRIATPRKPRDGYPNDIFLRDLSSGLLCLDHCTIGDIDYYANSRSARVAYLQYGHLLMEARKLLEYERIERDGVAGQLFEDHVLIDEDAFTTSLKLWRSGNKWRWPVGSGHFKSLLKIANHMNDKENLIGLFDCQEHFVRGGIKANGDVFALCDTLKEHLPDGTPLPWLEERIFKNVKTGRVAQTNVRHWQEHDASGEMTIYIWDDMLNRFMDRCAPKMSYNYWTSKGDVETVDRNWLVPRGLHSASNRDIIHDASRADTITRINDLVSGQSMDLLDELLEQVIATRNVKNGYVTFPELRTSVYVAWKDASDGKPIAWVIDAVIDIKRLAIEHGRQDYLLKRLDTVISDPQKSIDRTLASPHALTLKVRNATMRDNISDIWIPDFCLSFDESGTEISRRYGIPDDPALGWKEVLSTAFIKADVDHKAGFMSPNTWSSEALIEGGKRIQVLDTSNAPLLIQI